MRLSSTVILQADNEILLIKRRSTPFKDYWALVGGAKRHDESYTDCAIREVKEEVGISLRCVRHIDVIIVSNELGDQVSQVFIAQLSEEDLQAFRKQCCQNTEVVEAKLFPFNCLPEPIVPFHKEVIERHFK